MRQPSLFDTLVSQPSAARFVQKDLCAKRHGGNAESQEAHERVIAGKEGMWQQILDWALKQPHGFTCDEAAIHFMCPPNAISGRLSELKAQGRLVPTGERRKTEHGKSSFYPTEEGLSSMATAPVERVCVNCGCSYAQHTKGASKIKYCRTPKFTVEQVIGALTNSIVEGGSLYQGPIDFQWLTKELNEELERQHEMQTHT